MQINFLKQKQYFTQQRESPAREASVVKGALSDLRQFLANEIPLKMMKNAFYFTLKALFLPKIFEFLSLLFDRVAKRLD